MWSVVASGEAGAPAPAARSKHSATLINGSVYVFGGRSGSVPLRDVWRYNLSEACWTEVRSIGDRPPALQEHTAVAHGDSIYVFGGEVGYAGAAETPLWALDVSRGSWRKIRPRPGTAAPKGRRGHTALSHRGAMLLYGGYQDLRGSSPELWAFHFDTESWHLVSSGGEIPAARHKHSAVMAGDGMWVYGGMTDLQARGDLWRWDWRGRMWAPQRPRHGPRGPGLLHSHAAAHVPGGMVLLGGETQGRAQPHVWRFHFDAAIWERVVVHGVRPQPRADLVALTVQQHPNEEDHQDIATTILSSNNRRRHNQVSPVVETTYHANNPTTNNSGGLLGRLARRPAYTVLTAGARTTDSTESLLHATPTRLPKSRSAHNTTLVNSDSMSRDPVSVPNFQRLTLQQNSDDEEEEIDKLIEVKPTVRKVMWRDDSYVSHLGYADNPLYGVALDATSDYASLETVTGGFANPNYRAGFARMLNTPDSALGGDAIEMREIVQGARVPRARSASRVERLQTPPPMHVFVIGGKERGQLTVFNRPVSLWKLQLY